MTAVKQAMYRLDRAIGRLEHSVRGLERTMAGQQRDMFGNMIATDRALPFDPTSISERLDRAIEKVETILQDA